MHTGASTSASTRANVDFDQSRFSRFECRIEGRGDLIWCVKSLGGHAETLGELNKVDTGIDQIEPHVASVCRIRQIQLLTAVL